ncbi:hypothetical protein QZH41_013915 [Actinostola sp. cb2023]|nr:hypothetical protein QZH41_013915 [Actinostola sp. cb2023]
MVRAWFMDDSSEDQRCLHKLIPNQEVSLDILAKLGVLYYKLDADNVEKEGLLDKIKKERGYSYEDNITCTPEKLQNYEEKDYIQAKRLFVGEPVWTPHNRPADDHPARVAYVKVH